MKVAVVLSMVLSYSTVNALWFFGRNIETTATANGRGKEVQMLYQKEFGQPEIIAWNII